ncbi:hypothetical protein [Microbacterium sp. SLBN-146]|uniref:hypothetical protein n=1 Tax=Microbacterium sp. SLBN-146 TaxID=2768457 RepID=UPI00115185D5|nr:hypothetical protein [Microbacterium sp. SLBN-146]TQJ30893.1 hypothetical protein FBY39_1352 [Microbacterium sp. SLBN-146]
MNTPDDRIAELIAAALAGELTPSESAEFDRLRRDHPRIDDELRELGIVSDRLRRGDVVWTTPRDADALRERVLSSLPAVDAPAIDARAGAAPVTVTPVRPRPRRWITPLVGAACLAAGLVIGLGVPGLTNQPPSGPPGTLGAVEPLQVRDDLDGIDVEAELVAHTWGTEAILEATGLDVGATYAVVFIGADGSEFSAGEILGSEVPILCRMNAAVMRGDTVRFELRDAAAEVIAHADLPEA